MEAAALLHFCRKHHDLEHGSSGNAVLRQLAYKVISLDGSYDRRRVNELRGRQPDAITEMEVFAEVKRIINVFGGWP